MNYTILHTLSIKCFYVLFIFEKINILNFLNKSIITVMVAERLRRWTRNPMGFSLTGSNPVHDVRFYHAF